MKKYVAFWTTVLLIVLQCSVAGAASVTLGWNANSEADLAGYKVYWANTPRPVSVTQAGTHYPYVAFAGKGTEYTLDGLADGQWCFAATAYNTSGAESGYSNEACTTINSVPPADPGGMGVTKVTVTTTIEVGK